MFVIPCKFDPARPVVVECVRRIVTHHPGEPIVVVDSASDDKAYMGEVQKLGRQSRPDGVQVLEMADVANRGYAHGGHKILAKYYVTDVYRLLADSIWLNAPLPDPDPLVTVRWFSSTRHDWGWDGAGVHLSVWGGGQLERMGIPMPSEYRGVLGPYLIARQEVIDALAEVGYWDIVVHDKYQQCAMERVCGIVLEHLGYDVTVSLQDEHVGHWDAYDESVVTKLEMARS